MEASLVIEAVATIVLAGEADPESAAGLNGLIAEAASSAPQRLVLDVADLTHLSSAVLRCLVYAHQWLGPGVRIALVGASTEMAEAVRLAGFDHSITMRDQQL
jgi:anti-anti-sigma factor